MIRRVKSQAELLALPGIIGMDGCGITYKGAGGYLNIQQFNRAGTVIIVDPLVGKSTYQYIEEPIMGSRLWKEEWLEPLNTNNMDFNVTQEKILEAAGTSREAQAALQKLFPDAFPKRTRLDIGAGITTENGTYVLQVSGIDVLRDNHIHLNGSDFNFEIVKVEGFTYLKVTPK